MFFLIPFILLVLLGPRFGNAVWWLVQPARYNLAFPNPFIGILGIAFVPWTTLMYVVSFPGGLSTWDWIWIGFGLFADISSYGGGTFGGRKLVSGKKTTPPPTATPAQ